ncbi:hypothetical protein ALP59_200168 [Pseudomonas savastanoi]|uniref:Uncharacterized protein n=1 Tax=Pseudomonas savastanoi TaxID=29438 RepID=A0A3M5GH99_PSESS|nr:hypothetical protein ALP59_200168 [Pseudomonas savastanoi]
MASETKKRKRASRAKAKAKQTRICSGSRLKTAVLAISAFFGSDYMRVSGAVGSD